MIRADMNTHDASKFRTLNRMAETVVQRDLTLLNQIDETIDALLEDRGVMDVLADAIERGVERIKDATKVIDEDGKLVEALERTRDSLFEFHSHLKDKCESAKNAPELRPDDGVVEAYCSAIDSAARLHNAFNSLCWAIGEHDVDLEPNAPGGPYSTPEELFAALGV